MPSSTIYPKSFISKVKKAIPNDPEIEKLMETGSLYSIFHRLQIAGEKALVKEWQRIFERHPKRSLYDISKLI